MVVAGPRKWRPAVVTTSWATGTTVAETSASRLGKFCAELVKLRLVDVIGGPHPR